MKNIITIAICLLTTLGFAQNFEWVTSEGGYNEDRGLGVASDANGNTYVTGFFQGTATFGSYTFTSTGGKDIFLAKYNPDGVLLWAQQFGGQGNGFGNEVAVDASGNCYLAGSFSGTVAFGTIVLQSTTLDPDALLLKTDPDGNVLWARKGGGAAWDEARSVVVAGDLVYITGLFSETATFGSTTVTTLGNVDMFVAAYDLNGNFYWFSRGGGPQSEIGFAIAADSAGNAYVTGYFQGGQTNFGTVSVSNGGNLYTDMFVVKLDAAGTFLWARSGGTIANDDEGRGIAADEEGNVYVTGEMRDAGSFDVLSYSGAGIADIFVAKYDTSGTIQYLKQFGSGGGDYGYDIATYGGNLFVTGLFWGTIGFGQTTVTSQGNNDIYLAALNATTGDAITALRAGGLGSDFGQAVSASASGTHVTGDFEHNGSTFPPFTLNTNGVHDIFTAKLNFGSLTNPDFTGSQFTISPNPAKLQLNINSYSIVDAVAIYNMLGQQVMAFDLAASNISLDVSMLPSGIYMVETTSNGKTGTKKFVKD
ncbi:MAG TPA: SBBP repeat-containing protein [Flavobacterium sp.]